VRSRRWFLPEAPDVLGLLRRQAAITIEGLDAFAGWAAGGPAAMDDVVSRGDVAKRELLDALRLAFVTPLEPEDLFSLSRGLDRILAAARDVVIESSVLQSPPDSGIAEMATAIVSAVRHVEAAIAQLDAHGGERATAEADAAIAAERELEGIYHRGMAALLDLDERSARIGGRELYRRCAHIGDIVTEVAERVVYAVVKQS
jgi:uncharacterized protein Yka (UPF0111/DUF47 family)